jgi:hypothetical protein
MHGRDPQCKHRPRQNDAKLLFHNLEVVNSQAGGLFYQDGQARVLVRDALS